MQLHEFLSSHRDEILTHAQQELNLGHDGADVLDYLREFYDEMLRAVRRDSGVRDSYSPLPGSSETAARLGVAGQRAGVPAARVPAIFGAISQAVGKTGELYDLTIAAEEYGLLNRCLDAGVATSIENYWNRDKREAAERTTELYGHLAHELRTSLGNAKMAMKLMRAGNLNARGRTADVLERNLTRMGMLVAQCLTNARADFDAAPTLAPVNLAEVLRDVEASALPDRNIRIVVEVDELLFVLGDELLLSSAVTNLVHNAIKFSHDQGVVRLSAQAEGEQVWIRVDDECGGLGDTTLNELCTPYVTQRAGSQKGVGLGLAITKSAVEATNGELELIDRPGLGCTFVIRLPLLRPS
jgi:signal transduction histidine kinase